MEKKEVNKSKHQSPQYTSRAYAGFTILDLPRTNDTDQSEEVCNILVNLSAKNFVIIDRAQIRYMVITELEKREGIKVENLIDIEKGIAGFAHTGKN